MHEVIVAPSTPAIADPGAVADLLAYAHRHAEPGELEVTYASSLLGLLAFLTEHNPKNAVTALRKAADHL